jgi:predicted amidophosphoribosyltransferase
VLKAICKAPTSREQSVVHECRIADTDSARLWLAEGGPVADVLTMLEVRHRFELSPHFARAYAVEILSAARAEIDRTNQIQFNHPKEMQNAAA